MILSPFHRVMSLPLIVHVLCACAVVFGFQWVKGKLDASYAASNHPVDYATGQTTFSGETIKGYYATMQEAGTLDVYWQTQFIDFGFILAIACMGLFVATLVARFGRPGSWARRLGLFAGVAALLGALCDAIENGWSFVMLSDPTGFADWLALPYSAFASAKFALIACAMFALLASLLATVIGRATRKPKIG